MGKRDRKSKRKDAAEQEPDESVDIDSDSGDSIEDGTEFVDNPDPESNHQLGSDSENEDALDDDESTVTKRRELSPDPRANGHSRVNSSGKNNISDAVIASLVSADSSRTLIRLQSRSKQSGT